jgi:hypothetical protein
MSISGRSFVVGVLSQLTGPEEVSMHPTMMIALANEVQRDRESELRRARLRSLAVATPARRRTSSPATSGFARRLLEGISLRPRLS